MKKLLLIMAVALFATSMSAQNDQGGRRGRGDRKEMIGRMAEQKAKEMKLDGDTKQWFISLYTEYRDTLMGTQFPEGFGNRDRDNDKKKKELTDEEATAKVLEGFAREEAAVRLKREYYKKFSEKLTPQQVYSVFNDRGMRRGGNRPNMNGGGFQGGPGGFGGPDGFGGPGGFGGPDGF